MIARLTKTMHVTLNDVARVCGFSTSTVSIVLNEAPLSRYVAEASKERIRRIASDMGYHPNALARSLRRRQSQTIGVPVFDISDPFCISLLSGIEHALYSTRYLPVIMNADNRRAQFDRYLEMLLEQRVDGVVMVANWLFAEIEALSKIKKNGIPIVAVGRDLSAESIRSVVVDNETGGYIAIEHLYRLGHRRIAILRGPDELGDSSRRWNGIQRFASEVNLHLYPGLIAQLPTNSDPYSSFGVGLHLTAEILRSRMDFSAILAFDDITALGAIRALARAGRRVPDDCSVIGFDDVPLAALATPGLTTIKQPLREIGSLATHLVLEAITSRPGVSSAEKLLHLLPPILVERDSTQKVPKRKK